jgi:hypothetical protein
VATNRSSKEQFALYSKDCMTCSHLCETGVTAFVPCHYSKGNKLCPAAEVRIVIVGEALDYAKRVLDARDKRFARREAKLMAHVGKQSAAFRSKFYEYMENGGNVT